jgi:putative phosphoesterase
VILAAIGDIHAHFPALEAVLRAIDGEGIQAIVNTGDCVVGHPWPGETIECLRSRNIPTAQGEYDRLALRFTRKRASMKARLSEIDFAAIKDTVRRCRSEQVEFLRRLPRVLTLRLDATEIVVAHGTLASQTQSLTAEENDERYRRQRETQPAQLYIFGRTHEAHSRWVDDALFVNPGSVGYGARDHEASFAIVNTETEPWSVEFRVVEY